MPRQRELAVQTEGLTKKFGSFTAVESFDFTVPYGMVVALLGPNGAGKTTIVRMLATLTEPTGGTAVVCGHDVAHEPDAVQERHRPHRSVRCARDEPHGEREPGADGASARLRPCRCGPGRQGIDRSLRHR